LSYCIDTSVFIDAGERYYPPDIVPGFWEKLDAMIAAGRFNAPEMLITELEGKDDDWRQWVYERKEALIVPMDLPQVEAMQKVMAAYMAQGIDASRITGDPFFIALALARGLTVVTSEKPRKGGAKIPKLCDALGVQNINLLEMMRRENWRLVATG
jgi:predicted nucleic acid-binding protein